MQHIYKATLQALTWGVTMRHLTAALQRTVAQHHSFDKSHYEVQLYTCKKRLDGKQCKSC